MATTSQPSWPADAEDRGALATLVELSRAYGSDPEMVLGGGGNTSVKLDGRLMVKASGASLAEIRPENFVELDRAALQELLETDLAASRVEREAAFKEALLAARRYPGHQRPSVESVLHHLMPGRFVVHLHATAVNQFACSRGGRVLVEQYLGDDVAWVDLVDPGFILAKKLQEVLRAFRAKTGKERPRAVIMQNHGVVVSGETPAEARARLDWLLDRLHTIKERARAEVTAPAPAPAPAPAMGATHRITGPRQPPDVTYVTALTTALTDLLATAGEPHPEAVFDRSDAVFDFVEREDGRELALGGPLTPDQIVYCLSFPLWVEGTGGQLAGAPPAQRLEAEVRAYTSRYGAPPKVVLLPGAGMLTSGASVAEADTCRLVYCDAIKVMTGAMDLGGVNYLDEDFRTFIENWELESYRRKRLFGAT
jgi:rhamnose utilization protein RhaD (predicted bifunctional aldolase and dehydrogenase)